MQRFLKSSPDCHHLTDRFHLCREAWIRSREFFEGKAWDFSDDIVERRLKGSRRHAAGNIIFQLVQRVPDGQLGGDLGDRETRCLGSQSRRSRYPGVHLDHHQSTCVRALPELYVGATRFDTDLTQYRERGVAHDLIFLICQRLRRRDGDGITRVHPHGIEVFNRADDDAVVIFVSDNLHLVFLPTDQRLIDEQFTGWRELQAPETDLFELVTVIGDAPARPSHRE